MTDFIYTECDETCLTQRLQLARIAAELSTAHLRLVSSAVDPEYGLATAAPSHPIASTV